MAAPEFGFPVLQPGAPKQQQDRQPDGGHNRHLEFQHEEATFVDRRPAATIVPTASWQRIGTPPTATLYCALACTLVLERAELAPDPGPDPMSINIVTGVVKNYFHSFPTPRNSSVCAAALTLCVLLSPILYADTTVEKDLSLITDRLRAEALDPRRPPKAKDINEDISNQQDDGSWPDVDYDDRSRTHWKPRAHLSKILDLARAFHTPAGSHEGSTQVRDAFVAGLNYWVERDPQSDNWFRQSIGTPASLGDAVLLMGDERPPSLFEATGQLVRRSGFT